MNKNELEETVYQIAIIDAVATNNIVHSHNQEEDKLSQFRRKKIQDLIEQRFEKRSLTQRLNGETVVPEILRQGLYGFLPDETLLIDLYPKGNSGKHAFSFDEDPIWEQVSQFLTIDDKKNLLQAFMSLRKTSERLGDEKVRVGVSKSLGNNYLTTLGDLRKVSPERLTKTIAGFGKLRAVLIAGAVKTIEE